MGEVDPVAIRQRLHVRDVGSPGRCDEWIAGLSDWGRIDQFLRDLVEVAASP